MSDKFLFSISRSAGGKGYCMFHETHACSGSACLIPDTNALAGYIKDAIEINLQFAVITRNQYVSSAAAEVRMDSEIPNLLDQKKKLKARLQEIRKQDYPTFVFS